MTSSRTKTNNSHVEILVTCVDRKEAVRIAAALLKQRLVACGNYWPVFSDYRWKGKIVRTREVMLLMKTFRRHVTRIEKEVRTLHSYEVPAVIARPVAKSFPAYNRWLQTSVR